MPSQFPPLRVPDELHAQVIEAAKERGMTPAAYQREALRAFLKQGDQGDEIERLEARLVATMGRLTKDVRIARNDTHVVMAYIDSFVRSFLMHTPPVPQEAVRQAAAAADQRYERFMTQVAKALQGDTGMFDRLAEATGEDQDADEDA